MIEGQLNKLLEVKVEIDASALNMNEICLKDLKFDAYVLNSMIEK